MRNLLMILFLALGVFAGAALAQTAPTILSGDVAATGAQSLTVKTKDGDMVLAFDEKTEFKRVTPDKPTDLKAAVAASPADIAAGDKVVAVVELSDDKKTVKKTRRVILMTAKDIAGKQAADQARWTTRGIAGRVTAVNPTSNEITVAVRGAMGVERTMTVAADSKTIFKRYAAESVKYSDAKVASINDVKVGDQLRATGEKNSDNTLLTAEEVLSGSFRMVAGKIEKIDAANNEIVVKDAQTNKSVTIAVDGNTLLRRFPPEMATRMAQMQAMRAAGGGQTPNGAGNAQQGGQPPRPAGGQTAPNGGTGEGRPGGGGMGGGMRGGDVDSMLERMPALTLAELKVGDAVAASSSATAAADRVKAIKFVAGIEPFLNAPNIPAQGGRPASSPQINIPGLDGFGAP